MNDDATVRTEDEEKLKSYSESNMPEDNDPDDDLDEHIKETVEDAGSNTKKTVTNTDSTSSYSGNPDFSDLLNVINSKTRLKKSTVIEQIVDIMLDDIEKQNLTSDSKTQDDLFVQLEEEINKAVADIFSVYNGTCGADPNCLRGEVDKWAMPKSDILTNDNKIKLKSFIGYQEDYNMARMIQTVTREYLARYTATHDKILSIKDIPDEIADELTALTVKKIANHNHTISKDEDHKNRWPVPLSLTNSQVADVMATLFPIKRIVCATQSTSSEYDLLGIYVGDPEDHRYGTYSTDEDVFHKLAYELNYNLTKHDFDEVMANLKMRVPRVTRNNNRDYVAVGNGIFDYSTKKMLPFSPEHVFLVKTPIPMPDKPPVNPVKRYLKDGTDTGEDWDVESWMNTLSDNPEIVDLLWQIIGAIIRPNNRWNKSAWLYSDTGNSGKGTLCELMRQICGDTAYASIPLSDFGKDFILEQLIRASAIIVDENDVGTFIDKAGNLKAIITNDVIMINRKHKTAISYQFWGFMVQCLNEYPRIKDKSDSFYRRQIFIPMTKCFTGREKKYIKNEFLHDPEVLQYVLYKVLHMNYYALSEPEECKKAVLEYKEYNDPVRLFFDEFRTQFAWDLLPFTYLYDLFKAWFKKNAPSGTQIGQSVFIYDLLTIVRNDELWECKDKTALHRVSKAQRNTGEPLSLEYDLKDWLNPNYGGPDATRRGIPDFKISYRGLTRRKTPLTGIEVTETDGTDDNNEVKEGNENEEL